MKKLLLILLFASVIAIPLFGETIETPVPRPNSVEMQAMVRDIVAEYNHSELQFACMQIDTEDQYNQSNCVLFCGLFFQCRMKFLEMNYRISNLIRHSQETYEYQQRVSMNLFQDGDFISHAGLPLKWKIECDAIKEEEWETLAKIIREYEPRNWRFAIGIPRGGVSLGVALDKYSTKDPNDPVLIADDVYTTGKSFRDYSNNFPNEEVLQWCVFARKPTENNVKALFTMPNKA